MITVNGQTYLPGCYVDSIHGTYGHKMMIELADSILGTNFAQRVEDWGDPDEVWGTMDAAEEALNAVTTGGYWIWTDGDYMLVEDGSDLDVSLG